jgi:hypothetical protein
MGVTMSKIVEIVADTLVEVEKEDLLVGVLLINPKDFEQLMGDLKVRFLTGYTPLTSVQQRPEWKGELVGNLWGVWLVTSTQAPVGEPVPIPAADGTNRILWSLSDARERLHAIKPPPPKDPMTLSKTKAVVKKTIAKWLGIGYTGPRG